MNIQKSFFFSALFAFAFVFTTNAQNNIGIGTLTPNAKALLDLSANDKGFLVPRLTSAERLAINPAGNTDAALLVYDTNDNLFYFWDGTQWIGFPQSGGSNNISLNFDANTGILSLTDAGGTLTTNIPPDNDSDPTNELITDVVFGAGNILTIEEGGNTWSTTINVNDADSDPTNELQDLTLNNNQLSISITNSTVDLSPYLDNTDNQTLSLTGNTLSISNGNSVDLSPFAGDWKLLGNAGTNPANNFLGTTDNQALVLRTNNTEKVRVLANGNVGIGTATPAAKLTVRTGNIHTSNDGWSGNQVFTYNTAQQHPYFMGIRGEGTEAAPTYPTINKVLSSFIGRDVIDYGVPAAYGGASVYMITTENFSATAKGTKLRFQTTTNGTNTEVERMVIQHNGFVGIGTPDPEAPLHTFISGGAVGTPGSKIAQFTNNTFSWDLRVGGGNGWLAWVPDVASNRRWQINNEIGTTIFNVNVGAPENSFFMAGTGHIEFGLGAGATRRINLPNIAALEGNGRANAWETYSDGRIKSNQKTIEYGLADILKMQPKSYNHHSSIFTENGIEISDKNAKAIGFIAQEIFEIIPEVVSKPENENADLWSMSYEKLVPVLVKAIQEQQEIIQSLKIENQDFKVELNDIKQLLIDTRLRADK